MRIAIFGAGAVGSLIAARLALAGNDVVVFARGAHADAMATGGLILRDAQGERRAKVWLARTAAEAGPVSAIIVTTKGHHHCDAVQAIAPLLTGDQPVVFAVNGIPWWYGINVRLPGIDPSQDPARRTMDPGGEIGRTVGYRAVGAVIGSPNTIEAPGIVVNRTENNTLVLGAVDATFAPMLVPLAAVLRDAGIDPGTGPRSARRSGASSCTPCAWARSLASPDCATARFAPIPTSSPFLTGCPPRVWRWPARTVAIHRQGLSSQPSGPSPGTSSPWHRTSSAAARWSTSQSSDCRAHMRTQLAFRARRSISSQPCSKGV